MKNLLKIVLTVAVTLILFAGCSSNKAPKNLTVEEFEKNVAQIVDINNYVDAAQENDVVRAYGMSAALLKDRDFDFEVSLHKGTKLSIPMDYSAFVSQGWKLVNEKYKGFPLKVKASTSVDCAYGDKEIKIFVKNNTDEATTIEKGVVYRAQIVQYSEEDGFTKKLASAPKFSVCGNIKNKSDIKDITKTLGNPDLISYVKVNDDVYKMVVLYQNLSDNDNIKFTLTADGSKIVSVDLNKDISK